MKHYLRKARFISSLLCICLLQLPTAQAQKGHEQDSTEVQRLSDSAVYNRDVDTSKAFRFANEILEFSKKRQYDAGIGKAYVLLGTLNDAGANWPAALSYYQQALAIAKKENNSRSIGIILYNMSITYISQSAYDKSLETSTASLAIKRNLKDTAGMAKCYRVISEIYSHKKDFDKSASFIENAIALQRTQPAKLVLAKMLSSGGVVYMNLKQYDKAIRYLKEAEGFKTEKNWIMIAEEVYNNLGLCYNSMDKLDSAEHYYLLALELQQSDSKLSEAIIRNNLGQIYLSKERNDLAEKYLYEALALAEEINSIEDMANIHSNLADLYISKKDFKKAYEHKDLYIALSDSIMNTEKMQAVEELSVKFETKEMAYKNKQLEQKVSEQKYIIVRNLFWLYGSLSIAAIIILIAFFYTRQNKLKINMQRMELEQQQYRAQMNPHFIFNCMNSIQHYIVHNDVMAANKFLSEFATLMRSTLEMNAGQQTRLADEISYLENYLTLERMRFDDKFSFTVTCAPGIDPATTRILPMIIQPFAENAILHGLRYKKGNNGQLSVTFTRKDNLIECAIDDNGIGRAASQQMKQQSGTRHISQGMELIQKRLQLVNQLYKTNFAINVKDKYNMDGSADGTLVTITYPAAF